MRGVLSPPGKALGAAGAGTGAETWRLSDMLAIAAWAGTLVGLAEGTALLVCNFFPALLAPYKVSVHVLWVAAVLDVLLFGLVALIWNALRWSMPRHAGWFRPARLWGLFIFLGVFALVWAPKVIHIVGAAVLSAGLAVAACRTLEGRYSALTRHLRARVAWTPALVLMAAAGAILYQSGREAWLHRRLSAAPAAAPNVLLLVMDTVRFDRFGHGGADTLTPNLNRLAASGVTFENAWATSSWSLPSHASILTGRYPVEHGADWPSLELRDASPTLAEFLAGRGYVTGAFSGNAAWVTPTYLGRGFLRFEVYVLEDLLRRTVYGRTLARLLEPLGLHYAGRGTKADALNVELLRFLDDYPGRPFFAYVCYMDVNQAFHHRMLNRPFWASKASVEEIEQAYDDGLRELDERIGDLLGELERRGLRDRTIVIVTSDHGQSFGNEGYNGNRREGHGTTLYPEQLRVPLFLAYGRTLPAGRTVTTPVSLKDLAATIAAMLELPDNPFPDRPLPVTLELAQRQEPRPILATLRYGDRDLQSIIWRDRQYIRNGAAPGDDERLADLTGAPLVQDRDHDLDLPAYRGKLRELLNEGAPR
jgi:hypothetical protein